MKKTFVVSGAFAIALFAGLSSVPQVRSFVHSTMPSLGIQGGTEIATDRAPLGLELDEGKLANEPNLDLGRLGLPGKLVDIDQPRDLSPDSAAGDQIADDQSSSPIRLAQSTEPARTINAVQGLPAAGTSAKLSSFGQLPSEGVQVPSASVDGVLVVKGASLVFLNDIVVPAQADGIITTLKADEGMAVRKGDPIYQLDPRIANAEIAVQSKEVEQAKIKYEDKSELEFYKLAQQVAITDFQISNNLVAKGAEDEQTNRRKGLEAEKARSQVIVSEMKKLEEGILVGVSEAKLDAAKVQLDLRSYAAPWDAIVSEVVKRESSYVRAGEPILHLTDMRKIRVQGEVALQNGVTPHALLNSPARVIIEVAPGVEESVDGVVGFVAPKAATFHSYPIWIEIDNRVLPDGQYLFRGNMKARVEIRPLR